LWLFMQTPRTSSARVQTAFYSVCLLGCLGALGCKGDTNVTSINGSAGQGGSEAQGGGAGEPGASIALENVAASCSADADCGEGMKCLDEPSSGWPHGYCYAPPNGGSCPEGTVLFVSAPHTVTPYAGGIAEAPICAKPCGTDGECGTSSQGYRCLGTYDANAKTYGKTACAAWVQADSECLNGGADLGLHRCVPPDDRGSVAPGKPCTSDTPSCDGVCVTRSNANGNCATGCTSTEDDCNDGFKCAGLPFTDLPKPAPGYCLKTCAKDGDCENVGDTCDVAHGICLPP
jgi:hypothetical protein